MRNSFDSRLSQVAWLALALMWPVFGEVAQASEEALRSSLAEQRGSNTDAARTQVRVAQLSNQTAELLGDYRVTTQQLDRVRIYNSHLQKLVNDQEEEKASINRQLADFEVVEKEIIPFMVEMIDSLANFIELDLPFQPGERSLRVERLRDNMDRSDMTTSEKYRQIMEAYTIETAFGRDIEAYSGNLDIEGMVREVDFFRVGRILLAYQTLDREETGFWNKTNGQWEPLPDAYRNFVTEGLRIARKQAPPNLLRLPIPAAEQAQ